MEKSQKLQENIRRIIELLSKLDDLCKAYYLLKEDINRKVGKLIRNDTDALEKLLPVEEAKLREIEEEVNKK